VRVFSRDMWCAVRAAVRKQPRRGAQRCVFAGKGSRAGRNRGKFRGALGGRFSKTKKFVDPGDRRVARSRIVLRALELSRSGCVYPREISYRLLNVTNNGPYRRLTVFVETCRCGAFFTVGSLANRCVRTLISPKKNRVRTVFRVSVRLTVRG